MFWYNNLDDGACGYGDIILFVHIIYVYLFTYLLGNVMENAKATTEALTEILRLRDDVLSMDTACLLAESIISHPDCVKLFVSEENYNYNNPRISIGYGVNQLSGVLISLSVETYDNVTPLLELFAAQGWHLNKDREINPEPYKEIGRMSWYLKHDEHKHNVVVSAFFLDTSASCKWVKVEEDSYEKVTHYEIVCPDGKKVQ